MAVVNLKSAGSIEGLRLEGDLASMLERPAMLVYAGEFLSMDGPVKVTPKHVRLMVENHNKRITSATTRLSAGEGTELPLKYYPPIQVDHSTSGWDTVGRLIGLLREGEHELDDGTKVPAVYSDKIRILGKENVERVNDGRWTHLSLGVDLDKGKISELTITPFSAAPDASLLSGGGKTEGTAMNREQLKKHLMSRKNMSEKEAEEKLSGMDDDQMKHLSKECEDDDKKQLAADEQKKKDDEAKLAAEAAKVTRLAASKTRLTQLGTTFKAVFEGAQLAAKKGAILTRLSRLRSEAKITPAEIKKMDIAKLAAADESSIDLVLKTYADREPVIHLGQFGTTKAEDLARLGQKQQRAAQISQLEAETRANMSLLANKDKKTRLAGGEGGAGFPEPAATPAAAAMQDSADMAYFKKEADEICALMDQGSLDAAKEKVREWLTKVATLATPGAAEYNESNSMDTEAQMSALKESITKLQAQFNELHGFAGSLIEA